ncbi:MAG: hypothetical protein AB7V50_08925, partial [Vampirovibrionia bacterium]
IPLVKIVKNSLDTGKLTLNDPPPQVMCYEVAPFDVIERRKEDIQQQLDEVEELHNQKKIDDETYNTRKDTLLKQLESYE